MKHILGVQQEDRVVGDALHQETKLFLAFAQGTFGLPPLGQVARYFGEADQPAGIVPDRVDDDVSPEVGAVLADAPTLAFEFSLALGNFEGVRGKARLAVLLGIKTREILTDDFARSYPLKRLAPGFQLVTVPSGSSM